jgi:hypothetical protein
MTRNPRPVLTIAIQDAHLIAKLIDRIGDEQLCREGFTVAEVKRLEELHEWTDPFLTQIYGEAWDDMEALV